MTVEKMKHLDFIQDIINRMNRNSFQIKGWLITIVSALLALYADKNNVIYIFIAIAPTILFWALDTYYLQQERKFRGIYNDVAGLNDELSRVEIRDFEMPLQKYTCCKYCYFKVLTSITIAPLYGSILIGLLISGLILK